MKTRLKKICRLCVVALSVLFAAPAAHACDICAVYNSIENRGGAAGSYDLGVAGRYTHYDSSYNSTPTAIVKDEYIDSYYTQLFGSYQVSERVGLQLNLPFISRQYRLIQDSGNDYGSETGLGDIALLAKVLPVKYQDTKQTFIWEVSTGIKMPTGDTASLGDKGHSDDQADHPESGHAHARNLAPLLHGGQVHDAPAEHHQEATGHGVSGHDLTLGSGSWDVIFGSAFYLARERVFISGTAQYSLRTEGSFDYQFGNDFQWDMGPAYYFLLGDERTLSLRARFSGEAKQSDEVSGESQPFTSLTNVFAGPEVQLTLNNVWNLKMGVDIPIVKENSATQATPDVRMGFGLVRRFN